MLAMIAWFASLWSDAQIASMARVLGSLWWNVIRYRRGVIVQNLSQAFPEKTEEERRALGKAACTHLDHTFFEFMRIRTYAARRFDNGRIEGLEDYEAEKKRGKGVLCVSGHLGSFELGIAAIAKRTAPTSAVVKPFPAGVDKLISKIRQSSGLGLIYASNAVRPILRAMANNEGLLFVLGQ